MPLALASILLMFAQTEAVPVLNTSSPAAINKSIAQLELSLPPAIRPKFKEAINIMIATGLNDESAASSDALLRTFGPLAGKNARQIIQAAEARVRSLISEESQRQAKITSVVLPAAQVLHGASFACKALLSSSIVPSTGTPSEMFEITETTLLRPGASDGWLEASSFRGSDKVAIQLAGETLKFITAASVDMGSVNAAAFKILKNNDDVVVAIDFADEELGSTLSSFLLSKQTGLAVWTKSRPFLLIRPAPDTQSLYFKCQ